MANGGKWRCGIHTAEHLRKSTVKIAGGQRLMLLAAMLPGLRRLFADPVLQPMGKRLLLGDQQQQGKQKLRETATDHHGLKPSRASGR